MSVVALLAPPVSFPRSLRGKLGWIVLAVVVFLFQLGRAMSRDFDPDEHQFVAPPALLQQGALPYVDYPYFHMPSLIYLYAAIVGWSPYKLLAARAFSALCGTATLLVVLGAGWRLLAGYSRRLGWRIAAGMALTLGCSRLFTYTSGWAWNHDSGVLCTLLACLVFLRGQRQGSLGYFAAAGFLVGLAIGIRLSFALTPLAFALALLGGPSALGRGRRWAALGVAAASTAGALLPAWVFLVAVPDAFFFGNLEYARLNTVYYSHLGTLDARTLPAKMQQAAVTFLADPGNAFLLIIYGVALVRLVWAGRSWAREHRGALVLLIALQPVLWIGALGPTPAQYQYYYMALPFMVLTGLYAIAAEAARRSALRHWSRLIVAAAIVAGLTGIPRWYWTVIYLPTPQRWTTVQIHQTGQWLREHVPTGARVLTIDPLIALEGGLPVYPEYGAGRFPMHVGKYMTPEARRQYRVAWAEELDRVLAQRPPDVILASRCAYQAAEPIEQYTRQHGFGMVESPDGEYRLWIRPAEMTGQCQQVAQLP